MSGVCMMDWWAVWGTSTPRMWILKDRSSSSVTLIRSTGQLTGEGWLQRTTVAKIRNRRSRGFTAGRPQSATTLLMNGRWLQHHLDGTRFTFNVTKARAALAELQLVITSITACCCSQWALIVICGHEGRPGRGLSPEAWQPNPSADITFM